MPGLGHKSYIQFGPAESPYGTFRTPTQKLEIISWSVNPVVGTIPDGSLHSAVSRRALYQGGRLVKGTFLVRLNYEGLLELLRASWGSGSSVVVETGVRDHTFVEASALGGYSFEVCMGDIPTSKVQRFVGCKVSGLTIRGTAGTGNDAMLQAEFSIVGKTYTTDETPTAALSFPALLPVLFHQAVTTDDGTTDTPADNRLRSFEVSLENPLAEDRFYLGSLDIDEPLRTDFLAARWRFTQEFRTKTALDAAKAFTVGSPLLLFRHPTLIGAASYREFELSSGQANLIECSAPVDGYGILIMTTVWEAFYYATDLSALLCRVRNTEAALS